MSVVMLHRHPLTRRWALWAFALALLLKAAMSMLASASAQAQGKAVAEVCTVYGVTLVALDDGTPPAGDTSSDHAVHAADHCALNALPLLAAFDVPAIAPLRVDGVAASPVRAERSGLFHDRCARWVAALLHAPPATA